MRIQDRLPRFFRELGACQAIALTAAIVVAGFGLAWWRWDWLRGGGMESNGETLRNVSLVLGAVVALVLAVWRSRVAERQVDAAQQQVDAAQQQVDAAQQQVDAAQQQSIAARRQADAARRQADAAQRQADTAQRSLTYERYQKGVEMIGSTILAVRLGGIYALGHLAKEHPNAHHVQVMRVLCAFVCYHIPSDQTSQARLEELLHGISEENESSQTYRLLHPDVQEAANAIGSRNEDRIQIERYSKYQPDLSRAKMRDLKLGWLNFTNCNFEGADLTGATLINTNLSRTCLYNATLSDVTLDGADLASANLTDANLSGVRSAVSAKFTNAVMGGANLSYARLQGADFRHAELGAANLTGTVFLEGDLAATGLTQKQIALAEADANKPPIIDGLPDADTGERIRWSARPKIIT